VKIQRISKQKKIERSQEQGKYILLGEWYKVIKKKTKFFLIDMSYSNTQVSDIGVY
jgi:hypothetical protein